MIKKTNNTKLNKRTQDNGDENEDTGTLRKRGRPVEEQEDELLEEEEDNIEQEEEQDGLQVKRGRKKRSTLLQPQYEEQNTVESMDPEMLEMYKLLKRFDPEKLEKFNTVFSMVKQPKIVNTITFVVNQDVNLDIEYYNITTEEQLQALMPVNTIVSHNNNSDGQQLTTSSMNAAMAGIKPLERYRLILEYKDYNSRSELDRITKSQGARKFRNYVGNQVMEQFHKPLLGKILGQFEELRQYVKYDNEKINLRFENFNFLGSAYIMMAIINYFRESGTVTMGRHNGMEAEVRLTQTENPTFKIYFKK